MASIGMKSRPWLSQRWSQIARAWPAALRVPRLWQPFAAGRRLGTYTRTSWPWPLIGAFYLMLMGIAFVYGAAFGVLSATQLLPALAPLALLAAVAIWVMPALRNPPVRTLMIFFPAFLFALTLWPDYIALTLPGMPWITALRMTAIPMAILLVICAFGSGPFRRYVDGILSATPEIKWAIIGFFVIAASTVALSKNPPFTISRYLVMVYSHLAVFFCALIYFSKPGGPRRFTIYMIVAACFSTIIGIWESRIHHVPWAGHIPSFLAIEDPRVLDTLAGAVRAATGVYRVQSKYSTSIGLGEFMGMVTPFILHLIFSTRKLLVRIPLTLLLGPMLFVVIKTDSRLGFVSFFSAIMLYILIRALIAWRDNPRSIIYPALALAYPLFLAMVFVASFLWRRLEVMVWGGGAAQFSTASRKMQWAKGIPMILKNPLGHGVGQSGTTLDYIAPGVNFPTVDSYYLSSLLEVGVLGFLCFFSMFAFGAIRAGLTGLTAKQEDTQFLLPASIALINFLLSKSVYSQLENHPLAFTILGMVVALIRRNKAELGRAPPLPPLDVLTPGKQPRYVRPPRRVLLRMR